MPSHTSVADRAVSGPGLPHASPGSPGDPRVYFAAERTLLAWMRTGLTIMAFGFVVARFGLFLRLLALQQPSAGTPHHPLSPYVGAGLVLLGVLTTAFGGSRFRALCQQLQVDDMPSPRAGLVPLVLVAALVAAGLSLLWLVLR